MILAPISIRICPETKIIKISIWKKTEIIWETKLSETQMLKTD